MFLVGNVKITVDTTLSYQSSPTYANSDTEHLLGSNSIRYPIGSHGICC